jgi:hypothetical protein
MLKTIFKRVTWLARGTSMVLGLAVMLALVFGLTATALAAMPGDPFKLGRGNTIHRLTKLVGSVAGPMLRIDNNNANTNATALDLQVEPGNAPLRVNDTAGTAANLDADTVDGQDAEALKPLLADVEGNGNLDTLANIRGVVSVEKLGTGLYEVTFDRDVHNCVRVGGVGASLNSVYFPDPDFIALQQVDGQVSTFNSTRGGDKIGVITNSPNGTRADRSFQLAVYC